jgi:very-short-patch-repair endonuclease
MNNQYKKREVICISCDKTIVKRMPKGRKYCSLQCYRKNRPTRKTGKIVNCDFCKKEVYKTQSSLKKAKNNFCSSICANKYQGKDKLDFICKTCGEKFKWSKSRIQQANPTFCSMDCRNQDKNHMINCGIQSSLIQQKKRGLNKLEIRGREILQDIGLEFNEQVLMFDKFLVDVLLKDKKIIIQWDGEYWHNKPKRKKLDESQDAYFKKCEYKVLRITDNQIKNNIKGVYANIKRAVQ